MNKLWSVLIIQLSLLAYSQQPQCSTDSSGWYICYEFDPSANQQTITKTSPPQILNKNAYRFWQKIEFLSSEKRHWGMNKTIEVNCSAGTYRTIDIDFWGKTYSSVTDLQNIKNLALSDINYFQPGTNFETICTLISKQNYTKTLQ